MAKISPKYILNSNYMIKYLNSLFKFDIFQIGKQKNNPFDDFLKANMIVHCAQMHANGYSPISKKSHALLENKIIEMISSDYNNYKVFLKIYGEFSDEFKIRCLIKASKDQNQNELLTQMKADFERAEFKHLLQETAYKILEDIISTFFDRIVIRYANIGAIANPNSKHIIDFYSNLTAICYLSTHKSTSEDLPFLNRIYDKVHKFKIKQNKFIAKLDKRYSGQYHSENVHILKTYYVKELLSDLMQKIQEISNEKANQIIEQLKKKQVTLETQKLSLKLINDLPIPAKKMSREIKHMYESLNAGNVAESFKFELDKRLEDMNKIIQKYLSLDDEYRTSLKNVEGKSAYDLMMASLMVVHSDFDKMIKEHNQNIVNDISVLNRKNQLKKID